MSHIRNLIYIVKRHFRSQYPLVILINDWLYFIFSTWAPPLQPENRAYQTAGLWSENELLSTISEVVIRCMGGQQCTQVILTSQNREQVSL